MNRDGIWWGNDRHTQEWAEERGEMYWQHETQDERFEEMAWYETTPQPRVAEWEYDTGSDYMTLRVSPREDAAGEWYLYFTAYVGETSRADAETCRRDWPRDAIAKMRQMLDDLETKLDREEGLEE